MGELPTAIFTCLSSVAADGEATRDESNVLQSVGQDSAGDAAETDVLVGEALGKAMVVLHEKKDRSNRQNRSADDYCHCSLDVASADELLPNGEATRYNGWPAPEGCIAVLCRFSRSRS